jgi:para-nitrobenzyl esterase
MQWITGAEPPQQLADCAHRTWIRFAATGTVDWPRYEQTHRTTMRLDAQPSVVDDPYPTREVWDGVDLY